MSYVEYSSNNSGGSWWLKDEDWHKLEEAGWKVRWCRDEEHYRASHPDQERFLGALATKAERRGLTLGGAIAEWERVTGQDSSALGCYSCCGPPHSFYLYDDEGNWVDSYSPDAPSYGSSYEGE